MGIKTRFSIFSLFIVILGLLVVQGPTAENNRRPANDSFSISYSLQSSDQKRALGLYRLQESIIDAIDDNKVKSADFISEVKQGQQSLEQAFQDSKSIHLPDAESQTDARFQKIEKNLLNKIDTQTDYYYTIMENGDLRIQKVKTQELAVDNTQQLIQNEPIRFKVLKEQGERATDYGRLQIHKKNGKNAVFVTNTEARNTSKLLGVFQSKNEKPLNIIILHHTTNWGEVVYRHYPSEARFNQIKRKHLQLYLSQQFDEWQQSFDEAELKKIISEIIDEKAVDINGKTFKYLKDQRKAAAILRNGFYSYTKSGKAPKEFGKFVKTFGKLNDALQAENKVEAKDVAKKLKGIINQTNLESFQLEIKIISAEKLEKRMTLLAQEIALALENEVLESYDFHKMRKQLKLFLLIANDFRDYQEDSIISRQLSSELDHIITRLGDWHDTHIAHKLQGLDVLESFSINAVDRRLIQESLNRATQIILPGDCKMIFKSIVSQYP